MPGITGFIKNNNNSSSSVDKMVDELLENDWLENKFKYTDETVEISQVSLKSVENKTFETDDSIVFVEGFIYNLSDINEKFNLNALSFTELLSISYKKDILKQVLNKVNGYFSAVIYDKVAKKIFLMTDRMGLRYIYYYYKDGNFAFSGNVKGLLPLDFVDKTLDNYYINCFLSVRLHYVVGDNTFFKHIKLIKPSSIIEFDIANKTFKQEYYWKHSEIKPLKISYRNAVDKLHDLFVKSMERRLADIPDNQIGIGISGGLDSRLCIAAMFELGRKPAYVFTMGREKSADVTFAKMVCDKLNLEQNVLDIKLSDKWLQQRVDSVWTVDGMQSILDLHAGEYFKEFPKHATYYINGYCGDAIFGQTFKKDKRFLDKRMNKKIAKEIYGEFFELSDYKNDYYDIKHIEANMYAHRVRRYTAMGLNSGCSYTEAVCPFVDNDIIEFIFSIPDKYRADNKLYEDMLLKYYPDLFKDIPWQKIMAPVTGKIYKNKTAEYRIDRILFMRKRTKDKLKKLCNPWYKLCLKHFYRYRDLIAEKNTAEYIESFVGEGNRLCPKGACKIPKYKNPVLSLGATLTIEIYLRQLRDRGWLKIED